MEALQLEKYYLDLEEAILCRNGDFSALYVNICSLRDLVGEHAYLARRRTVEALADVLSGRRHDSQKQALFLYKEAAGILTKMGEGNGVDEASARQAISALTRIVFETKGYAHRAAAEALGSLPVCVAGPNLDFKVDGDVPTVTVAELLSSQGIKAPSTFFSAGRSLVFRNTKTAGLFVIKMARAQDTPGQLKNEAAWMEYLQREPYMSRANCTVPHPVEIDRSHLFKVRCGEMVKFLCKQVHPERYAVGFHAPPGYFSYVNDGLQAPHFKRTVLKNTWVLGKLTAAGIVHTAPIPLFHNRVQRDRRSDNGIYQWPRAGRLDRWLYSCSYPNFGLSGIRDFEHLISFRGKSRLLYEQIGSHFLSFLLVVGSYFRNKDRTRVGVDQRGRPIDARELFDRVLLRELIDTIFKSYYVGFVGKKFSGKFLINCDRLTSRMVEEMGVDRHMVEVLRIADQNQMSDEEFRDFLLDRGLAPGEIAGLRRGAREIEILTGPHLGGFNDRISLPELIEFVATAAALCIAGKFQEDKREQPT